MKNNSKEKDRKIEITNLSNQIVSSDLEDLSNLETAEIVGGWSSSPIGYMRRGVSGILSGRDP